MDKREKDGKSGFDYFRLCVYIIIAFGAAFYVFFRTAYLLHSLILGVAAGLISLILIVLVMYKMDNGRLY